MSVEKYMHEFSIVLKSFHINLIEISLSSIENKSFISTPAVFKGPVSTHTHPPPEYNVLSNVLIFANLRGEKLATHFIASFLDSNFPTENLS